MRLRKIIPKGYRGVAVINLACLSLLFGLLVGGDKIDLSLGFFYVIGTFLLAINVFLIRPFGLAFLVVLVIFSFYSLGVARGQAVGLDLGKYKSLEGQKVTLRGTVFDDPAYADKGQYEFFVNNVKLNDEAVSGKVRIRSYQAREVLRGDEVVFSGKLRDGFASWQGTIYFAEAVERTDSGSWAQKTRRDFIARVNSIVPEPEGSLGIGFLLGSKSLLDPGLEQNLRATGLTHIVAVSGYNLTVIVNLIRRAFRRSSKSLIMISASAFIFIFVAFAGESPSLMRAVVVSGVSLFGWYFGRPAHVSVILLLSSAVTAFLNPFYVWGDLGWYLSFAAFFGVLVIAPRISKSFKKFRSTLGSLFTETFSAQIMTWPISILVFKQFSLVSLPANVVVGPMVPLAMLTIFTTGATSYLGVGGYFAIPALISLRAITLLAELFASLPLAFIELTEIQANQLIRALGAMLVAVLGIMVVNKGINYGRTQQMGKDKARQSRQ